MRYFLLTAIMALSSCYNPTVDFDHQVLAIESKPLAKQAVGYQKLIDRYQLLLAKNLSKDDYHHYLTANGHWQAFNDATGHQTEIIKQRLYNVHQYYTITLGNYFYVTTFDLINYDELENEFNIYIAQLLERNEMLIAEQTAWQIWFTDEEAVIDIVSNYLDGQMQQNEFKMRSRAYLLKNRLNSLYERGL